MTALHGWGLPEQHLALDALVAFVDGELSPSANGRAAAHLARCPVCAADAAAQRQARAAVRSAETPAMSQQLLRTLRSIPSEAELPGQPDELALTPDGQLVTAARRGRTADHVGASGVLGSGAKLGETRQALGSGSRLGSDTSNHARQARGYGRRTRQGAGVVFSGLVLGALAFMNLPPEDPRMPATTGPQPLPGGAYGDAASPASARQGLPASPAAKPSAGAVPAQPHIAARPAVVPSFPAPTSQR